MVVLLVENDLLCRLSDYEAGLSWCWVDYLECMLVLRLTWARVSGALKRTVSSRY